MKPIFLLGLLMLTTRVGLSVDSQADAHNNELRMSPPRLKYLRPDLVAIRGWMGWTHLLLGDDGVVAVDSGFIGDARRIQRAIAALGRKPHDLKAILLTHGHLDHTANVTDLQRWSGAVVYAPAGEELHIAGRYPYKGLARCCGVLELLGRTVIRYKPPTVDTWVRAEDKLPFWGGLQVVALPGHTAAHSGYYSESKRVVFVGDAFAVSWRVALPPRMLSTGARQARASFKKATAVNADLMVPTHYFRLDESVMQRVRAKAAGM
jgi:glyoxylase-like metal-dependent hydrolase (beta-lactamase superfamily II)